jgi:hypothetical protein
MALAQLNDIAAPCFITNPAYSASLSRAKWSNNENSGAASRSDQVTLAGECPLRPRPRRSDRALASKVAIMKFGVLQFFSWPDRRISLPTVYERVLQRVEIMDRSDYDAIWVTEHHFNDYSVCPSIPVMGAFIAARTTRMHIATGSHAGRVLSSAAPRGRDRAARYPFRRASLLGRRPRVRSKGIQDVRRQIRRELSAFSRVRGYRDERMAQSARLIPGKILLL